MWAFNGRFPNDITTRAPNVLPIVQQIVQNVKFPRSTQTGNSAEVMAKKIGGDADDYITATYGIPSVTAELGESDQFFN